jgi:hypothetical protein
VVGRPALRAHGEHLQQQATRLGFADLRTCLQALLDDGWTTPQLAPPLTPPRRPTAAPSPSIVSGSFPPPAAGTPAPACRPAAHTDRANALGFEGTPMGCVRPADRARTTGRPRRAAEGPAASHSIGASGGHRDDHLLHHAAGHHPERSAGWLRSAGHAPLHGPLPGRDPAADGTGVAGSRRG